MKINEIFYSLQGEGANTGTPAVFLRFSGCNLSCPFCDTRHRSGREYSENEIISEAARYNCEWVILTGGEPTLQLTASLIDALHGIGKRIAIETNGTRPLPGTVDFVTLSPKDSWCSNAKVVLESADEIKIVFDGKTDPQRYLAIPANHYFLQPCDTGDAAESQRILSDCVAYVLSHPQFRLSLQTQKIIHIP